MNTQAGRDDYVLCYFSNPSRETESRPGPKFPFAVIRDQLASSCLYRPEFRR